MLDKDQYSNEEQSSAATNSDHMPLFIEKLKSHSFSEYLDASIIVMVIGLFIAMILAFLVQFIFRADINWTNIGINTLLLSACTSAIYILLRSYAQRKGRRTEGWKKASERLQTNGKSLIDKNYVRFAADYCRQWEDERFDLDIEAQLKPVGLTRDEYETNYRQYSKREIQAKYKDLPKYQLKAIMRAKRVRRAHFDERYFFVNQPTGGRRRKSPSGGLTTQTINRITTARIILNTFVMSFITATFFMDVIFNFSAEAVVLCVIKTAMTIFFGAMGMIHGYQFTSVKEVAEMNARSDEIEIFEKWCENNK